MEPKRQQHLADLELAQSAAEGSLVAWHEFVIRYSGLIFSLVRRYLVVWDEDDRRTVYVQCLEYFYRTGLARFDGRASLSTWVMTVTRSRCLDSLRSRRGRKRPPTWLAGQPAMDREIYRLHFLEGRSYGAIAEEFRRRGRTFSPEMLGRALARIEARMDHGLRLRLAYELQARSVGAVSGRLLEYLDHLRGEQQQQSESQQADFELVDAQSRQVLQQVEAAMTRLQDPEGQVLRLYYYEGLPAPEIARRMALRGPRRVYTLLDRGVAMLRTMMGAPVLRPERISHPEGEG